MSGKATARELWACFETVHDVIYFSPLVRECGTELGLKGFWMAYFAFRIAPLGEVGPEVATAAFYNFHLRRARRALPDAWTYVTAEQALSARAQVAAAALRDALDPDCDVSAAAQLAWTAAQAADVAGRPLTAANRALPRPLDPVAALWQATTVLREHRGEGHNAVLLTRGIGPIEAHLIKCAAGEADPDVLKTGRGFDDREWAGAREQMLARGLIDAAGRLTEAGRREHDAIEEATDALAADPWRRVGPAAAEETLRALKPLAAAVERSGIIPVPSPVGLVRAAGR